MIKVMVVVGRMLRKSHNGTLTQKGLVLSSASLQGGATLRIVMMIKMMRRRRMVMMGNMMIRMIRKTMMTNVF